MLKPIKNYLLIVNVLILVACQANPAVDISKPSDTAHTEEISVHPRKENENFPVDISENYRLIETDNIRLYSQLSESQSKEIAANLELFHYILLEIFEIENTVKTHRKLDFFLINDQHIFTSVQKNEHIPAFFTEYGSPRAFLDIGDENMKKDVVYHEYFHYFHSSYFEDRLPMWLNEGLAQYFQHFHRSSFVETVLLGGNNTNFHPRHLKPNSDNYNKIFDMRVYPKDRQGRSEFYLWSWVITDWLMDHEAGQKLFEEIKVRLKFRQSIKELFTDEVKSQIFEDLKYGMGKYKEFSIEGYENPIMTNDFVSKADLEQLIHDLITD